MASGICKIKRQASHRLCRLNLTYLHMFFPPFLGKSYQASCVETQIGG